MATFQISAGKFKYKKKLRLIQKLQPQRNSIYYNVLKNLNMTSITMTKQKKKNKHKEAGSIINRYCLSCQVVDTESSISCVSRCRNGCI
jgi:hypothetical protein